MKPENWNVWSAFSRRSELIEAGTRLRAVTTCAVLKNDMDEEPLSSNDENLSLTPTATVLRPARFEFRCGQPPSAEEYSIARGVWSLE